MVQREPVKGTAYKSIGVANGRTHAYGRSECSKLKALIGNMSSAVDDLHVISEYWPVSLRCLMKNVLWQSTQVPKRRVLFVLRFLQPRLFEVDADLISTAECEVVCMPMDYPGVLA